MQPLRLDWPIHFTVDMPHSADKISIRGGNGTLTGSKNSHMTSQAGTAGGCADSTARIDKDIKQAFFMHSFQILWVAGMTMHRTSL
jgi:hypothetical protein